MVTTHANIRVMLDHRDSDVLAPLGGNICTRRVRTVSGAAIAELLILAENVLLRLRPRLHIVFHKPP
jgi:hypothetical protein